MINLLKTTDFLTNSIINKVTVVIIFSEFARAFNKVPHQKRYPSLIYLIDLKLLLRLSFQNKNLIKISNFYKNIQNENFYIRLKIKPTYLFS